MHWIGIDVGGTVIKYAVFDRNAAMIFHDSVETPRGEAHIRIPQQLAVIMDSLLERFEAVQGVGISTAGVVDPGTGEIVFAGGTIPEYKGTNLKRFIQDRYGLSTVVANDVNAAAWGEKWKGAARSSGDFFCITLGTGIGGALFCEGKLVAGAHYRAGEIGHSLYDKTSGTTYEQRASMTALLLTASRRLPGFTGSGQELFAKARMGSMECLSIIEAWAEEIARGLAQIVLLFDPSIILIGGGVSEQKEFLLDKIKLHMGSYLPAQFSRTELITAELGNRAALYGAVYPYYMDEMGVGEQ
ncbi:ROK family protein [Paenibacillus nasutitermitis]|uniref:Glucokinase n=1 Tax=Paenibacillus nasutitermitis TaxID=1652958 RepID=A0A916YJQ3_9BACL|nr:ROK family protein [Paenibacillus nasutitermitis]GGD47724.1 glucokinase [Paenibacillus nasutitermitis]